jgi:predicted phosphohydrolase
VNPVLTTEARVHTHELHREVEVPTGDILIHAGDFTMFSKSMEAVVDFNDWLGKLPHRHKIVVPGNHEFFLEADPSERFMLDNAIVLINEGTEIEGLRIWGSPVTPLYGGAFGLRSAKDRKRLYAQIPMTSMFWLPMGHPSASSILRPFPVCTKGVANCWTR